MATAKDKELAPMENNTVSLGDAILKVSQNENIDPERLEKFLDIHIKLEEMQSKKAFQEALAGFQSECPIIQKTSKVSFGTTKYNYAKLDEIAHQIRPLLKKYGLSYTFNQVIDGDMATLITTVHHKDGYSEKSEYYFDPMATSGGANDSQKRKSALTYAKRAGLENALGLITADEDDDARRAVDNLITEDQTNQILDLVKNTKTDMNKFLSAMNITLIGDLTEKEAKKAINLLRQKRMNNV